MRPVTGLRQEGSGQQLKAVASVACETVASSRLYLGEHNGGLLAKRLALILPLVGEGRLN